MRLLTSIALTILLASPLFAQEQSPILVSVPYGKAILLNGKPASLSDVDAALKVASTKQTPVWFHRDYTSGPNMNAIEILGMVIKYKLPVSLSTKSDFSDYVDDSGRSFPRK